MCRERRERERDRERDLWGKKKGLEKKTFEGEVGNAKSFKKYIKKNKFYIKMDINFKNGYNFFYLKLFIVKISSL